MKWRIVVMFIVLLACMGTAAAQTADLRLFTAESRSALIKSPNHSLEQLKKRGYTHEVVLTQDLTVPWMLVWHPEHKNVVKVNRTSSDKKLVLPASTHVLVRKLPNGKLDYSDFAVLMIPKGGSLVDGCGNICSGVNIKAHITVPEETVARTPLEEPVPLPIPRKERPKLREAGPVSCKDAFVIDADPQRLKSALKGAVSGLPDTAISLGVSALTGGWEYAAIGGGGSVIARMIADAIHPTKWHIKLKVDEQWQQFPAKASSFDWNGMRVNLAVQQTDLGGKVASVLVDGHPECSTFLPLPNNRNHTYVFALGEFGDNDKRRNRDLARRNRSRTPEPTPVTVNVTNNNTNIAGASANAAVNIVRRRQQPTRLTPPMPPPAPVPAALPPVAPRRPLASPTPPPIVRPTPRPTPPPRPWPKPSPSPIVRPSPPPPTPTPIPQPTACPVATPKHRKGY